MCPYWQNIAVISVLAPVVQTMDSAIHRINHYRPNKHKQNQLSYPVDSDLSGIHRLNNWGLVEY